MRYTREQNKKWNKTYLDKMKSIYGRTKHPEKLERHNELKKIYDKNHPDRVKARAIVNRYKGKHITQYNCVKCDGIAEEFHHYNGYDEEHKLDVVPLCRKCHLETHFKIGGCLIG